MASTKLSTKGQLIIPKDVRDRHGWVAGTELLVEDLGHAVVIRSPDAVHPTTLKDVVGCLRYRGRARSLAEMQAAIAAGALDDR